MSRDMIPTRLQWTMVEGRGGEYEPLCSCVKTYEVPGWWCTYYFRCSWLRHSELDARVELLYVSEACDCAKIDLQYVHMPKPPLHARLMPLAKHLPTPLLCVIDELDSQFL